MKVFSCSTREKKFFTDADGQKPEKKTPRASTRKDQHEVQRYSEKKELAFSRITFIPLSQSFWAGGAAFRSTGGVGRYKGADAACNPSDLQADSLQGRGSRQREVSRTKKPGGGIGPS